MTQYSARPDNHLVLAILSTIFCCIPLGIVSIVRATQVSSLWAQGRFAEAQRSADGAKRWATWSVFLSLAWYAVCAMLF